MESWCKLVSLHPNEPEPKDYAKALQTANSLLSSDLAPFEIEWLVQTLLYKPIDVFNTIASKRGNEDWLKNIGDSFKVISKIVNKYWSIVERDHDTIIKLCTLSFDAQTKKEAINCHICVLKNPGVNMGSGKQHINALEAATTCKAPLALLVGNICKYCPESVDHEYIRVWRIYLNMLHQTNITDTVMNAILQGIDGLFENFGRELPIMELNDFYKDLSRKCAKLSKCIEPLLSILKSHASLFKERLSEDLVIRTYLWGINSPNIKDALLAIYTVIFEQLPLNKIKDLINKEIQARMDSDTSTVKHTALSIAIYAKIHHQIPIANMYRPDVLEFQMRHRSISNQEADLVSICLASRESYVKSLLVTVIMYYDNIPLTRRQKIVVEGIIEASKDIRKVALSLLLELSRQDGGLHKYADVWREILDSDVKGTDILEEVLQHVVYLMKAFIDSIVKEPEQMLSLSSVLSFVLCVSKTDDSTQYKELLRPVIVEVANILCVCPTSLLSCKFICVEMFKKDSVLKEILSCFDSNEDEDNLSLMQLIFSKPTTDTKLYIKALSDLDKLLKTENMEHRQGTNDIMKHILKLKSRKNFNTSDDRIFQRDLTVFLGEHSSYIEKENFTEDLYFMEMNNKITVTIPNITNGKNYKIDLLRILQISLVWEDLETLYCILTIICANLRDRLDPGIQTVVWRICRAVIRSGEKCDVTTALRMCSTTACVQHAVQSITDETDPEVRKRLCDSLQVMLLQDPGSETSVELLTKVAEQLLDMISCPDKPKYKAGLDITQAFINTLQENDEICIKFLPKIIILTSVNPVKEVYKCATNMFIEKIDNFDEDNIKEMIEGAVKSAKLNENKINLGWVLDFLKKVFEARGFDYYMLIDLILSGFEYTTDGDVIMSNVGEARQYANVLQILALSKQIFEFDDDVTNSVITMNDCGAINKMVAIVDTCCDVFVQQNFVRFLNEYAVELLDNMKEQTIKCLSKLIENIPPSSVTILKQDLTVCLSTYKRILTELRNEITHSFSIWCQKINTEEITEELTQITQSNLSCYISELSENTSDNIQALGIMTKIFEIPIIKSEVWTKILLKNDDKIRQNIVSILLSISEKAISNDDFELILKENKDFVVKFLSVYFERCLGVVLDSTVFVHVVKYFADNYRSFEDKYDNVVELINKVWPNLEDSSFDMKLSVASDILRLPKTVGLTAPVEWVKNAITGDDASLDHKIKLITMLPGGDEYSSCYRHLAGKLPIRVSEMRGDHAAILRSLLDSLSTSGDLTLLEIIVTLAAADDTKGWWDEAIDACMASLAERRDENIYDAAYQGMKRRPGLGGCRRVFLPLLRHSTRAFCEEYSSKIISDIISTLKTGFKEPSNTEMYRERVLAYAKSFLILQVVIDKIPSKNLETGIINVRAGSQDPWYVIKEVCICSVTLRTKVRCPDNASEAIKDACLRLQCSAYNCLVSALCKRCPSQKQYGAVFSVAAWSNIVDTEVVYDFWPRGYRIDYKSRKQLDKAEGQGLRTMATTSSFTATVRTRIFMATLSENPLQYDMIPNEEEEEEEEEEDAPVSNSTHPLNVHGCLVSITTLLVHISVVEQCSWLAVLADGLGSTAHVNAKWTLAQAICNAETELKPHASILIPALLDLVVKTPKVAGDKKLLNNLHIDILWTIIKWNLPELTNYENISTCVEYLISTCVEYKSQNGVFQKLLNTLNTLLQMYGTYMDIDWSGLQKHLDDLPASSSYLMPILLRILKNKVQIPGLLTTIVNTFDPKAWMSTSKLPEVFGMALSLEKYQKTYLEKFWQILANVRSLNVNSYVKMLMYAQRAERRCCNAQNFRIITDYASKVEKSKCLTIISVYLDHLDEDASCSEVFETIEVKQLLEGDSMLEAMKVVEGGLKFMNSSMKADIVTIVANNCRNSSAVIRRQAYGVMMKLFQDLVKPKETSEHLPKRQATQSTVLLDSMSRVTVQHAVMMREVARGLFDGDEHTATVMRDGLHHCLDNDITLRFAELFYIIFYLSKSDNVEFTDQGYVFLELLFRSLKQQDGFTDLKLSDEPLPENDVSLISGQKFIETYRQIDIQMPIANILDVLIESAKINSKFCVEICVRIAKCIQNQSSSPRFDLDSVMAKLLTKILKEDVNSATPFILETSRIFLDSFKNEEDFKEALEVLKKNIENTEGISYYNVLYEDFVLREIGRNFFKFNIKEEINTDIEMKDIKQEFSIEGIKEIFGHLSNWDDLRIQDKRNVEESLPPLMTENADFKTKLKIYFEENNNLDYKYWFNKMAACYISNKLGASVCQFKEIWFNDIQKWPVREFVTSSVIEAVKWPEFSPKLINIGPNECLAEWAYRLMIRSSYFDDDDEILNTCRDDEFKLLTEANRRRLPNLALDCVKRNKSLLLEEEAPKWFEESLVARRFLALKSNDSTMLEKILEITEREDNGVSVCIKKLILLLKNDLGVLCKESLDDVMLSVDSMDKSDFDVDNRKVLKSFYGLAMEYYNELWDSVDTSKDEILSNMAAVIEKMLDNNLSNEHNLLICMLLNRLADFDGVLHEDTAKRILDLIVRLLPNLDSFSVGYINNIKHIFAPELWSQYDIDRCESVGLCREYLQLICDPAYTLLQYCAELAKDLNNWKNIYDRIKNKYGSTYGGTDYRSLNTIKKKLFDIENSDIVSRHKLLKPISTELEKKLKAIKMERVLRLSQLSPSLTQAATLEGQRENLRKLLGLPPTVYVVKFVEKVKVFMDSIRRPCVVTVLLSDGSSKRYMIKSGEPLSNDASVQRIIATFNHFIERHVPGYNVTTLSDDCAILEYLEDHDRLRDLMGDKIKIPVTRLDNVLEQYNSLCNKIPVYTLRCSIEERCASMEEFIIKKQKFLDTLSTMTITNWLFGIGDRHLQNIMYNKKDGGICAIDWASIFQYGLREFVPARLTGNILAVCNVKVLESRLQSILVHLRQSRKLFEAFTKVSFYWKNHNFEELAYIKDILQGNKVSYEITRDVIDKSNIKSKEDYIKTLDTVFEGFTHKHTYSVEEQISCLLQHCTDPKILPIIPQGWESWI